MRKQTLKIGSNVRYLNDLISDDGKRFELPNGILAKGVTGCGGTTLALEDSHKTIIASPRKALIECKARQYENALLVMEGVGMYDVKKYLEQTETPKILTTYDSLFKVANVINDMKEWRVVVDEFQCILSDSSFKSDTELKLISDLKKFPYVTYMSATPMLDEYLEQIDVFKDIPYTELVWENQERVNLNRIHVAKPINAAVLIVKTYLNGGFPVKLVNGKTVESRECVIFLNSVQNIATIVKNCNLTPEQVNIIVGDNEDNLQLLRKIGDGFEIGSAPLKGEEHKMFTFCTSTAYMGVDFYSTNAMTFVVSDCKKPNTAVDIATELVQIVGRQRLAENAFRDEICFIYNIDDNRFDDDAFIKGLETKMELSEKKASYYNILVEESRELMIKNIRKEQKMLKYANDFVYYDEAEQRFKVNQMAYLSEKFSFMVQRKTYRDSLCVNRLIEETKRFVQDAPIACGDYVKDVITRTTFEERMRTYIEYRKSPFGQIFTESMERQHPELLHYYDALGPDRIVALGCKESKLRQEIEAGSKKRDIQILLCQRLVLKNIGYTTEELRDTLNSIYRELNIKAKATVPKYEKEYGFKLEKRKKQLLNTSKDVYYVMKKPLDIVFDPEKQG